MSFFNKIEKPIPENDNFFCPICNAGYATEDEIREISCPVCKGKAKLAIKADNELEKILTGIDKIQTNEIEKMIQKLNTGFYRAELRTELKRRNNF